MDFSMWRYPGINSKIRGMYAQNLSYDDLNELIRQKDLKSAVYFLKNELDSLKNIDDNSARDDVEKSLDLIFINDIRKIYRLLSNKGKELFMQFLLKYEIKCVKSVLKKIVINSSLDNNLSNVDLWCNNIFLNIKDITSANNIEQFLEIISKRPYYKIIKNYLDEIDDINKASIFELESRLDKFYFQRFYKSAKNQNKELANMVGTQIDLLNIVWIYRAKKYYNLSDKQLKNVVIDVNYKLSKKNIDKMMKSNSFTEFKDLLLKTQYRDIVKGDYSGIERNGKYFLYKMYRKIFRTSTFDSSIIFCYMYLQEIQDSNIINIIGGIKYNLDINSIKDKVIM